MSQCSIQTVNNIQRIPINRRSVLSSEEVFTIRKDYEDFKSGIGDIHKALSDINRAISDLYQKYDSITTTNIEVSEDEDGDDQDHEILSNLPPEKDIRHALSKMDKSAESNINKLPRLANIR